MNFHTNSLGCFQLYSLWLFLMHCILGEGLVDIWDKLTAWFYELPILNIVSMTFTMCLFECLHKLLLFVDLTFSSPVLRVFQTR